MTTMEEYPQDLNENQYDFVHFNTILECDRHIINNRNINIAYKCCEGRGYATLRKITKIIPIPTSGVNIFIPIEGTCDICFLEGTSLYNTCNTCSQSFCKPCLAKITSKICPYCRGVLKNNF